MKIIANLFRVLIGLTYIFSGFVKLDDPTGFSYKLDEYFSVFAGDFEAEQDTLSLTGNFNDEPFEYQRALFIGDAAVDFQTKTELEYVAVEGSETDSTWKGNYTLRFDDQIILSKDFVLADSNTSMLVTADLGVGGSSLKKVDNKIAIGNIPDDMEENVDVSSFIKSNSWLVGFFQDLKPFALPIGVFVSILELILGFALLIGWKSRFTGIMLLLLTGFFTFLTWYSWVYNKVTDCGCFGDAIPLNPEESFYKNLIFMGLILVILFWAKKIKPIFSNPFAVKLMAVVVLLSGSFAAYCKYYLPVIDFLKFKEGNNICELREVPDGEREQPLKITEFEYLNEEGVPVIVTYNTDDGKMDPNPPSTWKFSRTLETKVLEEAYEPPIHDFIFMDLQQNNNYIDDFLASEQKLLVVMHDLDKVNKKAIPKIKKIAEEWTKEGKPFWALTASSAEKTEAFRHEHNLPFEIYLGDNTNLKSIVRSNPGLLLLTDTCVVKRVWPSTRLPKYKKIKKLSK